MPSTLTHDQLSDFAKATISNFKQRKWVDISLDLTEYIFTKFAAKAGVESGGAQITFDVQVSNTDTWTDSGLYAQDVTNVTDMLIQGTIPWTKQTGNYSYDEDELEFQQDERTIVSLLLLREHACMNKMAEFYERRLWGAPAGTSDNKPMGVPFWIQKDATTTPGGAFNGGNPSGFTSGAAGISSSTYTGWKNWAFGYTNITEDDLVAKVKKALWNTNFLAPDPFAELAHAKNNNFSIYTTYDVREACERRAETRNDNMGSDLAKYVNQVMIAGIPITAVPYLQANDLTKPVYGVNWKYLRPYFKTGRNMKRIGPLRSPTQKNVFTVHFDTWMNFACFNRRGLWVGSQS